MAQHRQPAGVLNIALWAAQVLLAVAYGLFGSMKATKPLAEVAVMMKWIPDFPPAFVRGLGVVEMLGAIGLILPMLTRIAPRMTFLTAVAVFIHQLCAITLHLVRGEANVIGLNLVLIALTGFVAWGRRTQPWQVAGRQAG
jgi:uncharacterized membrane protein YphA (DoxX/SURF4 family)